MARLPTPGADNGVWGDVLNSYLSVSLNPDGSIKAGAVSTSHLAADSVTTHQIATGNAPTNGQVLSYDGTSLVWITPSGGPTLDATTTSKGIVQLAGDLGGTATNPTVPGLAGKENAISPGTSAQYLRGDKTWQSLDKAAVGLGSVDNTADSAKPISAATQTALDSKVNGYGINDITVSSTAPSTPAIGDIWLDTSGT